jgi:hypothetical protein
MPGRRRHRISSKTRGGGIGAKLGVYDDVFLCLSPGEPWLEHGIVEHRYKELCPEAYLEMIDRWGHVSQGPRRYSVTAFLTGARSQLRATAFWQRSSVAPLACINTTAPSCTGRFPLAQRLIGSGRGPTSQRTLVSAPTSGRFRGEPPHDSFSRPLQICRLVRAWQETEFRSRL